MNFEGKKVYVAAPWWTPEMLERLENVEDCLAENNCKMYRPRIDGPDLGPNASDEDRTFAFQDNVKHIEEADFIVVITDGKDVGTIWEAGFAYGKNIPVIYFCNSLPEGATFNVMLAKSAVSVALSFDELDRIIKGEQIHYTGAIR